MPLVIVLLIIIALVFWLDRNLIFRFLYFGVNLWLLLMYLTITELQTVNLPQVPWFEPTPVSETLRIYLSVLLCVAGGILFFVSRILSLKKTAAFFPLGGVLCLSAGFFFSDSNIVLVAGVSLSLIMLAAHVICFALNSKRLLNKN